MEKSLFAGCHFDQKRFGKDINLFKKESKRPPNAQPEVAPKLDFFGSSETKAGDRAVLSRKKVLSKKTTTGSGKAKRQKDTIKSSEHTISNGHQKAGIKSSVKKERVKANHSDEGSLGNGQITQGEETTEVNIFKSSKLKAANDNAEGLPKAQKRSEEQARIEAVNLLRKQHKIKIQGQDVAAPLEKFEELVTRFKCKKYLLQNLRAAGYEQPTPIQRQAIPVLLSNRECFACAPTGSGKTVAFLVPILASLKAPSKAGVRAVILCPTRELALQTARELKRLTVGKKFRTRIMTKATAKCVDFAASPCDILISTPLRLSHLLEETKIDLRKVRHLVMDESDKLFELGFLEQIDTVVEACAGPNCVRSLFSATLPDSVEELARSVMEDPIRITVGGRNAAAETVKQRLVFTGSEEGKLLALRQLFQEGLRPPVLIFVQSKERAKQLHRELAFDKIHVDSIHADRTQAQREAAVEKFRAGETWVLIATDVMGRGMDFKGISMAINYDCPQSTAAYIHRIGRTGRAGRQGQAVTFYTEADAPMVRPIANVMAAAGCEVPAWMLALPKPKRQRGGLRAPDREDISTIPKYDKQQQQHRREMTEASKKRKASELEMQDA